ncbi:MAG TPA: hypothetical protein PLX23_12060, partial [Candidatus Hydrogenedens sp.]|nr:hypothetical protein [Candidatus Hydrogenedens sp.]
EPEKIVESIKGLKNIEIEGTFSHFSLAFYKKDKYTKIQFDRFIKGIIWERMALTPDWALCYLYNSIIIALLEEYYANHGEYPVSLQEIACYFTEEDLTLINEYFNISISPQNYCIDFNPEPHPKRVYKNLYCHWNMVE